MRKLCFLIALVALSNLSLFAQQEIVRVYADNSNQVHVVFKNNHETAVAGENGQIGIDSVKISKDGQTAGWLALYSDPDQGSQLAGTLNLWRNDKIVRTFQTDQTFWSWSFYADAPQVAYHVGPTHGEHASHCELHEIVSGKLLASWEGDLDDPNRPQWTKGLEH